MRALDPAVADGDQFQFAESHHGPNPNTSINYDDDKILEESNENMDSNEYKLLVGRNTGINAPDIEECGESSMSSSGLDSSQKNRKSEKGGHHDTIKFKLQIDEDESPSKAL